MRDLVPRVDRPEPAEEVPLPGRRVRHLDYYEVFAALRYAIVSIRTTGRGIALGQMPAPENFEDRLMIRGHLELMLSGEYWRRAGAGP